MIRHYKGRELNVGDQVSVYKNLNNGLFSIKKDGQVVAHGDYFYLKDGQVSISEKGRQRAIKEGRRNVHAVIKGIYAGKNDVGWFNREKWVSVSYNPFKGDSFINRETGEVVEKSDLFFFVNGEAKVFKDKLNRDGRKGANE